MFPGAPGGNPPAMHAPAPAPAPHAPSPLLAMLMQHAHAAGPPPMHPGGMAPQSGGAPLPLGAGGHPAAKFGHAPTVMPC